MIQKEIKIEIPSDIIAALNISIDDLEKDIKSTYIRDGIKGLKKVLRYWIFNITYK